MFKDELKKLRTEKKWTQEKLAKLLGVAKSTISMYENGNRTPDLETFEKMALLFNMSLDNLIYGDDLECIEKESEEQIALTSYLKSLGYIVRDIYEPSQIPIEEFKKQEKLYLVPEKYKNSDFVPAESHSIEIVKDSERYILGDDDYTELGNCIKECIAFKLWQKKKKVD